MNTDRVIELAKAQLADLTMEVLQLRAMVEYEKDRAEKSVYHQAQYHGISQALEDAYASMDGWEQRALTAEARVKELEEIFHDDNNKIVECESCSKSFSSATSPKPVKLCGYCARVMRRRWDHD